MLEPECPVPRQAAIATSEDCAPLLELDFVANESAPVSLYAERLRRSGIDYALAFVKLLGAACASGNALAREATEAALCLGPKVARLSALLSADGCARFDPIVAGDAHANLMLIETLDRKCREALMQLELEEDGLCPTAFGPSAALFELLSPLSSQIPRSRRRAMRQAIAERRAPSPFCVEQVIFASELARDRRRGR